MTTLKPGLQLDIACTIARIQQIRTLNSENDVPLRELLIMRLQYDANRLRGHLDDETIELLDHYEAEQ